MENGTRGRGDDGLVGTERPDYVDALGGDDVLVGLGSGDMLRAGEGNDVSVGGDGDDYFVGDAPGVGVGPDNIDRVGGDDLLHGGAGPDTVNGNAGPAGAASFLPLYALRVPREERMMLEKFGEAYRAYAKRTGRVVPRLMRGGT